jgi:long-subunit acyl-CoA synthetase (AMP-forming)
LCQGEYIAPEKIEVVYMGSKYVMQVFVDGNSLEVSANVPKVQGIVWRLALRELKHITTKEWLERSILHVVLLPVFQKGRDSEAS